MSRRSFSSCVALLLLASGTAWGQQDPRDAARPGSTASAQKDPRRAARGPLPDPALLDGSTQQPEKKPEYGMLGEFEMPGDDNAKPGGKVGGQQSQMPAGSPSGGGQQGAQGAGGAGAMAQAGAAGGAQQQGGPQGQQGGPQGQQGGTQAGNQNAQAGGNSVGQNDPNAKADGMQVAGLQGDPSDAGAGGAGAPPGNVPKPQQVALGDPSMRIKPAANAAGAVGAVSAGNTQQMETKIGGGSGGGSSSSSRGGGAEKGRVMPAGL